MHARNRTWLLGSDPVERCRQRTMNVEGGDGSTLSLDFTTGVLDPRLTFTRSTNATFINSQGYVQFADANMFVNSAWTDANNTPTGWTLGSGTGSVSRSNETRTLTCATQQYWWYQQPASRSGLTYSVSVEVTAVSGSMVYGDIILAGSSTYIAWYKDGVLQATSTATPVTTGVITLIFTANSDNTILRLGLGSAGTNVTGSVTLRYPQFQQGQVPLRSYYENTSTSVARFNSARFDYDPTTLAPRGLLIEGSAANYANYSNALYGTGWNSGGTPTITPAGGAVAPDGVSTSTRFVFPPVAGGNPSRTYFLTTYPAGSYPYTVSVWMKSNTAQNYNISILGNTTTNNTVTPVWQRFQVTATAAAPLYGYIYISNESTTVTTDISMWGVQLEAGNGASSYIPTGASTGSRAADSCVMTGSNFSSWFNESEGTFIAQFQTQHQGNTSSAAYLLALDSSASKRLIYLNTTLDTASTFDGTLVISAVGDVTGVLAKVASAYNSSERAIVANGGAVATGFPTRLSNSQLQVLTA
jgi:hypothetical protein